MTNLDFGMVLDYSIENLRFGLRKTIEIFEYSEFLLHYMQCNYFDFTNYLCIIYCKFHYSP